MVVGKKKTKNNYSTKQDNVPHDDEVRKSMIEQFILESESNVGTYEVVDAVPYDGAQAVRSTAGSKRKSD